MLDYLDYNDIGDQRQQECQEQHCKGKRCNEYEHCVYRTGKLGDPVGAENNDVFTVGSAPCNF